MIASPTPHKKIVLCCDGSGNQFGDHNSNVIKLFSALKRDQTGQILYYHPGVGTKRSMERASIMGDFSQKFKKWHALAYGYGVLDNLRHAYQFLMRTYNPGDEIYLFGFSRGAFTVRTLCSFIYEFGLLETGNDALIDYALSLFIRPEFSDFQTARSFQGIFGRQCTVHFVGVWDTVSSVGWIYNPLSIPYTYENPIIRTGRHALAIDEHRCFYQPNMWGSPGEGQDFKQVWFAGAHADIGGGYPYHEAGLANITLAWMLREAEEAGILIDEGGRRKLEAESPPSPFAPMHHPLKGLWWIPEYLPQETTSRVHDAPHSRWGLPRGRARTIPNEALIHKTVIVRMQNPDCDYHPVNLPAAYTVVGSPSETVPPVQPESPHLRA